MSEHQEQVTVIQWFDNQYPKLRLFAIPNGSNKSIAMAVKFKKEGLRKGVPDLFLPHPMPPYHGLFIEMKDKGKTPCSISREQKEWIKYLQSEGYAIWVCFGADQAIEAIKEYLNGQV